MDAALSPWAKMRKVSKQRGKTVARCHQKDGTLRFELRLTEERQTRGRGEIKNFRDAIAFRRESRTRNVYISFIVTDGVSLSPIHDRSLSIRPLSDFSRTTLSLLYQSRQI